MNNYISDGMRTRQIQTQITEEPEADENGIKVITVRLYDGVDVSDKLELTERDIIGNARYREKR